MSTEHRRYYTALFWLSGYLLGVSLAIGQMRGRGRSVERCRRFRIAHTAQALVHFDRDITGVAR